MSTRKVVVFKPGKPVEMHKLKKGDLFTMLPATDDGQGGLIFKQLYVAIDDPTAKVGAQPDVLVWGVDVLTVGKLVR